MNRRFLFLLSLFCVTGAPAPQVFAEYAPIEAYESKKVAGIDVTMENLPPGTRFDPNTVLGRLKTKMGSPFSQLTFDEDLKALAKEYDRVDPSFEVRGSDIFISLKVWPRPIIASMKWTGNEFFSTKTLKKELGIKTHTPFNREKFNKGFNKVKEHYIKKGYFEAQLSYRVELDPRENTVNILINIDEGRAGKIDDIVFTGFTPSEESKIFEMINTKKYNLFTSWFTGSGIYHEDALEQDRLIIVNFLQNEGFADARVDIQVDESKSDGKVILRLTADKGPVYHFGTMTFEGNTLFTDKEIESRFLVRPENVYSPEKLRETVQAIKDMYGRKGHIETAVQYEAQLVEEEPLYNVHFTIEEGLQYKIGLVHIIGNCTTQNHVILRESHLVPGETFDTARLKATQMRLENIGYFKNVNVYSVRAQDDHHLGDEYRDVYIEVEETTTGNLNLFFGLSSGEDIYGGLDLTETNFNYRGLGCLFSDGASALRGGGEYAHARLTVGERQRSYLLAWMTPYFRDTLWRVGFDITQTHSTVVTKHYDTNTVGGSLYASYPLSHYWTFGTKYRLRDTRTHLDEKHASEEERKIVQQDGLISAISSSISYDSCDSHIKPHNGLRSVLEAELAGLGGNFSFVRFAFVNAMYNCLWSRGIMKYRAEVRFIEPIWNTPGAEDIPISERFFLGGESTVRGYKPWSIGPRFNDEGHAKNHGAKHGDPTGGISSSLLSAEYLQEVFSFLDLFVFFDAGAVSMNRFKLPMFQMSYGGGVRLEVMNHMPLVIGYGVPINPTSPEQIERLFFSMGGQF